MDPRWLPWCWGAGAAACAALFFAVQPWRAEFRRGAHLIRKYPAAAALPAALLGAEALAAHGRAHTLPHLPTEPALAGTAAALLQAWHGFTFGPAVALLSAGLLAANAAGLRQGFLKGTSSVTSQSGARWLALLLIGAAALIADASLARFQLPAVWHAGATLLAIPLVGWPSAAVLAGLLLLAETEDRAPKKVAGVRWLESSAAHSLRLWPWALGHGSAWWLGRWLPPEALPAGRALLAALGLALAFAPLLFLHLRSSDLWGQGAQQAGALWRSRGWQALAWLAAAGLGAHLWGLAGRALAKASSSAPPGLQVLLAVAHALVQIGLTVLALSAWGNFRAEPPPPPARPLRRRAAPSP